MRLYTNSLGGETDSSLDYDYFLIPLYGQSLALNVGSTPFINPSVSRSFSFDSDLTVVPTGSSVLTSLAIQNDTISTMAELLEEGSSKKFIFGTWGTNGSRIDELDKGTLSYSRIISGVTEGKRIADAEGKTFMCPAIAWSQGEAQYADVDDNFTYEAALNQLISDFNTDIKAITGQSEDVYLMITQVGTHGDYWRYPRIAMQQPSAANNNELIYLSKAMYVGDFATDNVHGLTQDYALMGVKYGYQILTEIINGGKNNSWINPISHSYNTLKSVITFSGQVGDLIFETQTVNALPDGNKGFKLFNVSETPADKSLTTISEPTPVITLVEIIGSRIEITYDSDPTGSKLTYGVNALVWDKVDGSSRDGVAVGRTDGARGNLRDYTSINFEIYNSSSVLMYDLNRNWCPIFEIQL